MDNSSKASCFPALPTANVQHLTPKDGVRHPEFFVNMIDYNADDEIFLSNTCFSDEENLKFIGKSTGIRVAYVEVKIRTTWFYM